MVCRDWTTTCSKYVDVSRISSRCELRALKTFLLECLFYFSLPTLCDQIVCASRNAKELGKSMVFLDGF